MRPLRLDHTVVAVSDPERAETFYRDVLGAEVRDLPRGRKAYRFGEQQLNVHMPGSTPEPVARVRITPGSSDLCFVWDGPIDGAIAHLRSKGVAIELGPVQRTGARGDGMSVYFRDPDGSLLEFISYARGA
jgi:catechol 2,3-dioxygenase-like lactoylglutathione lyase family enzyme